MTALEYNPDQDLAQRIRASLPRNPAPVSNPGAREVAARLWASLQQERFHDEKRVDVDVADLLVLIAHAEATA